MLSMLAFRTKVLHLEVHYWAGLTEIFYSVCHHISITAASKHHSLKGMIIIIFYSVAI